MILDTRDPNFFGKSMLLSNILVALSRSMTCEKCFADRSIFPSTDIGHLLTIWAAAEPAATIIAASIPVLRILFRAVKDNTLSSRTRFSTKRYGWHSSHGTDAVTLMSTTAKTVDMDHGKSSSPATSFYMDGPTLGLGKNMEIVKTVSISVHGDENI